MLMAKQNGGKLLLLSSSHLLFNEFCRKESPTRAELRACMLNLVLLFLKCAKAGGHGSLPGTRIAVTDAVPILHLAS